MTLTSTRTYVRYFGADQIEPIGNALKELSADWSARRPFVSEDARNAGDLRLSLAINAVTLLMDRVPE